LKEYLTLWNSIKKRRNEWIEHVLRHGGMLRLIIQGCVEGKSARVNINGVYAIKNKGPRV